MAINMLVETENNGLMPDASPFPDVSAGEWLVLHTRSRNEKALASDLAAMGIAHYLPLIRRVRYYGGRKAIVEAPLFPSYLFLRGTIDEAYRADRTQRLANIIRVNNQQQLDWELRNLYLALTKDASLDAYPHLKIGVRVEVRSGPFEGLQGVVEDRTKMNRLILKIDILGQAVSMEVDGSLLDVIE